MICFTETTSEIERKRERAKKRLLRRIFVFDIANTLNSNILIQKLMFIFFMKKILCHFIDFKLMEHLTLLL